MTMMMNDDALADDDDDIGDDDDDVGDDDDDDAPADWAIACLRLHSNPIFPAVHKMFIFDDDGDDNDDPAVHKSNDDA